MHVLFTIQHPAHVHLFRNAIRTLETEDHEVTVLGREKDINIKLLESYDLNYELLVGEPSSSVTLPVVQLKYEWEILKAVRQYQPDVLVAMGEPGVAHAGAITGTKSILFTDTEHATLQNKLSFPFADRICTPECYEDDLGEKQVRYPGYHELAYLHPDRFKPDPSVFDTLDVDPETRFVVFRLVSWEAAHDVGGSGFNNVVDAVEALERTGVEVLISGEGDIPEDLLNRRITIPPHKIHHVLFYADLFIGESATMAAESAVMGTPAIYVSSIPLGYLNELENRYGLVFNHSGEDKQQTGINHAISILSNYSTNEWELKREKMLANKIDVTEFLMDNLNNKAP